MYKDHSSNIFEWLIWTIFVLSIADLTFTIVEIGLEIAYEFNPFLGSLYNIHPALFIFAKIALTAFACAVFWYTRDRILTKVGVVMVFFIYLGLLFFHIIGIIDSLFLPMNTSILDFAIFH